MFPRTLQAANHSGRGYLSQTACQPRHGEQRPQRGELGPWETSPTPSSSQRTPASENGRDRAWGKGERTSISLLSSILFSLFLIYGKIGMQRRVERSLSSQRGMLPGAGSAGMLRARSFSGCLQKGSQTTGWSRGRETGTSILRFKMQIPPLSFRWRGQGLPIPSSPPLPAPSPSFVSGGTVDATRSLCWPFS